MLPCGSLWLFRILRNFPFGLGREFLKRLLEQSRLPSMEHAAEPTCYIRVER